MRAARVVVVQGVQGGQPRGPRPGADWPGPAPRSSRTRPGSARPPPPPRRGRHCRATSLAARRRRGVARRRPAAPLADSQAQMATVTETPAAPFSSDLAAEVAPDALQRFLRYVRIDTQSRDGSETYPSTAQAARPEPAAGGGAAGDRAGGRRPGRARLRDGHPPRHRRGGRPGGGPDRPRGHQPGRQRDGRLPAHRAPLRRRRDHVQRRSGPGACVRRTVRSCASAWGTTW